MRRRGCLLGCGSIFGLLAICVVVGFFFGLPRLRDSIGDGLSDAISTQVADQIPATDIGPGEFTISLAEMEASLAASGDVNNAQNIAITSSGDRLNISFTSGDQKFGYSGRPVVVDGKVVFENMTVDNDFLGWVLPADELGDSLESGVNAYFEANNLKLTSVTVGNDEITVEAVDAGS